MKYEDNKNEMMPIMQSKPKLNSLIDPLTMATIESLIERHIDGNFACIKCDFKAKNKGHMKEHAE